MNRGEFYNFFTHFSIVRACANLLQTFICPVNRFIRQKLSVISILLEWKLPVNYFPFLCNYKMNVLCLQSIKGRTVRVDLADNQHGQGKLPDREVKFELDF